MADLRAEVRCILIGLAAERRTIVYRDLAKAANIPPPQTIHKLTDALEDMVHGDHAEGRPLLAALAVSRGPEGIPGPGFFRLAASLGLYDGEDSGPSAQAFHRAELGRAYDYWGAGEKRSR
ncbi:MAG: hypothetical protein MI806_15820 [Minwuiales bacterium]|nr:hypothetical protein [Minwuiales bacterium]